jgi:hypothetical protein
MPRRRGKHPEDEPAPSETAAPSLGLAEVEEAALFLVRIFGEEARDIAAHRAEASEQGGDWRRVGAKVDELLQSPPPRRTLPRRRFRAV